MASTSPARRALAHAPWSRAAWRDTVFVVSGVPLQLAGWLILGSLWWLSAPVSVPAVLILTAMTAVMAPAAAGPLTAAQRERFWAVLALDVPRLPAAVRRRRWGVPRDLRSPELWRTVRYHLLVGPFLAAGGLLTGATWAAGALLSGIGAYAWALPDGSALSPSGHAARVGLLTALGVPLLAAAPWAAAATRGLDVRAASALLGPDRARELERRVEELAEKRAGVVDAADLERRRIERDLHDGAQQRLVSMAMSLGLARETLTGVPDEAMRVIVEAHEEAKAALGELRDLVRGLHPAVLADRGLDAALSGVAARVPVPVRLLVRVEPRASSTVEAVAYFVVSEALTNIVRHARATGVDVEVVRRGDVLGVRVADDGAGGADPSAGTGLRGLARRVRSVDGTFRIASPAGGPTTVTAELPCAL